jgi:hypothetical protein
VGLVEQEKMIVPFAEGFLGGLVAFGEEGDDLGGVDAGLGEVACGLGGFAESVEVLIVLRVEAADVFGEPGLGDGDKLCAAEIEVDCGAEAGLEAGESEFDFFLLLFEALEEFAFGFFSERGEVFAEALGVGCAIVGVEEVVLDVGVAHLARCTAQFAKRTLERFGLLFEMGDAGGETEKFEGGFDSPGGGSETMDAFG